MNGSVFTVLIPAFGFQMEEPNLTLSFLSVRGTAAPENALPFLGVHSVHELQNLESSVKIST